MTDLQLHQVLHRETTPLYVFDLAALPQEADRLYQRFVAHAKEQGIRKVETGEFGAHMDVLCANDGPVTLIIDTEKIGK